MSQQGDAGLPGTDGEKVATEKNDQEFQGGQSPEYIGFCGVQVFSSVFVGS